jgi:hypothetical protein
MSPLIAHLLALKNSRGSCNGIKFTKKFGKMSLALSDARRINVSSGGKAAESLFFYVVQAYTMAGDHLESWEEWKAFCVAHKQYTSGKKKKR